MLCALCSACVKVRASLRVIYELQRFSNSVILLFSECRMWLESSDLPKATQLETAFKLKMNCPDSDTTSKWEHMGVDNLQST